MIWRRCAHAGDVRTAASTGRWTTTLRAHVQTCAACGEIALVTQALCAPVETPPVHGDPALLWMQARLTRRLHAEAQVSRVVTAAQMILGLTLVAGLVYAAIRVVPAGAAGDFLAVAAGSSTGLAGVACVLLIAGSALLLRGISTRHS